VVIAWLDSSMLKSVGYLVAGLLTTQSIFT